MQEKLKQSLALKDKSFEMEGKVQEAVARAQTAVYETKDLMEGLLAEDRRMYKYLLCLMIKDFCLFVRFF